MNVTSDLKKIQETNKSMICLGLDLDPKRMPSDSSKSLRDMFDFAHRIIEATSDIVCAYKPNLAFFESLGTDGFSLLKLIVERVPEEIPVILDGKRGDIGSTASHYASSMYDQLGATWVTVNPYMGYDSIRPFAERKDKGVFILCLTSNSGSKDFQLLDVGGKPLYQVVAEKVAYWNKNDNCGLVVGATQPEELKTIREIAGEMPLLIPGVGAQGGSLELAARNGTAGFTKPAIINVSRSVLYASKGSDFAQRARQELEKLNAMVEASRANSGGPVPTMPTPPSNLPFQSNQEVKSDDAPDNQQQAPRPEAPQPPAPESRDMPAVPEAPKVPEAPETREVPKAPEVPEAPERVDPSEEPTIIQTQPPENRDWQDRRDRN